MFYTVEFSVHRYVRFLKIGCSLDMLWCGSIIRLSIHGNFISDAASFVGLWNANQIYVYTYTVTHDQGLVY